MASHVPTQPKIGGSPALTPGKVTTPGKSAAKNKQPRMCHTIDTERPGETNYGLCGARLGKKGGGGEHNRALCESEGHLHCKACDELEDFCDDIEGRG